MAKRATEAFVTAVDDFKKAFTKDQIVPAEVAKKLPELVYDDGASKPARKKPAAADS